MAAGLVSEKQGCPQDMGMLSLVALCNALLSIRDHLLGGGMDVLAGGLECLKQSLVLGAHTGDDELMLFLEAFFRTYLCLGKLSLWTVRGMIWPESEAPSIAIGWIRHRISRGRPFLFPSQYAALSRSNALSERSWLASMPTGGGKSLIAELFILKVLSEKENGRVAYVVPSRALAAEKRDGNADAKPEETD